MYFEELPSLVLQICRLRAVRDRAGDRFKAGVLLYTGPSTLPFGDRLAAVPLEGLWAPPQ